MKMEMRGNDNGDDHNAGDGDDARRCSIRNFCNQLQQFPADNVAECQTQNFSPFDFIGILAATFFLQIKIKCIIMMLNEL